ncbi:hypothetical protein [Corynebacterium nasicanis]|uniref:Transcriptional regulator HTH-type FeoC domain-containing protein n=1 Tax=Corynebacterium nasicanis TaxID=1448267 RepID=A0ABW1QAL1_9CORY
MTGPVAQIRAAVDAGARTTAEIAGATGLPTTLVSAVVQHFHKPSSCASTSCGGCPVEAGCGGPVLLTLGPAWNNEQK